VLDVPSGAGNHSMGLYKEVPEGDRIFQRHVRKLNVVPEASSLMFQQLSPGASPGCHLAPEVWIAFVPYHNISVVTLFVICKKKEAGCSSVLA